MATRYCSYYIPLRHFSRSSVLPHRQSLLVGSSRSNNSIVVAQQLAVTMVQQPYLYGQLEGSRTSIAYPYSDFNPRAATQAHYQAFAERAERQKKLSQQDGRPLINFNQHPDSYMVVNNPEVHHEPLPSNTKGKIIGTRWVQFAFRILQEVGALGVLVCVICLKMANDGPGWIIRIAVSQYQLALQLHTDYCGSLHGTWSSACTPSITFYGQQRAVRRTVAAATTSSRCSWT